MDLSCQVQADTYAENDQRFARMQIRATAKGIGLQRLRQPTRTADNLNRLVIELLGSAP